MRGQEEKLPVVALSNPFLIFENLSYYGQVQVANWNGYDSPKNMHLEYSIL